MPVRLVEGKLPYTGGDAITVDENKVISLNLRDENNLIIYDAQDDEIYVDLQLPDGIKPTDAFPVGVTTGRVLVADGWDKAGTIISAKTTSGDVIKLLYADEGTLWIDNGTGTFKQIYFKADVDGIITTLTAYINAELAKKQNGVVSATAPSNPAQGDLWYDTTSNSMKVYDGTNWNAVGTGGGGSDIEYVTQAEYEALLPGALTDNKHYFIYEEEVGPTPPSPGWQPGVNTIAYWKFDDSLDDEMGNYNGTNSGATITYSALPGDSSVKYANVSATGTYGVNLSSSIWLERGTQQTSFTFAGFFKMASVSSGFNWYTEANGSWAVTEFGYGEWDGQQSIRLCTGYGGWQEDTYASTLNDDTWYSLVRTYDHTTRTKSYYVNGTLLGSVTASHDYVTSSSPRKSIIGRGYNGGISNCVFETNTVWTAQDVSNFHNTFKSLYGIS